MLTYELISLFEVWKRVFFLFISDFFPQEKNVWIVSSSIFLIHFHRIKPFRLVNKQLGWFHLSTATFPLDSCMQNEGLLCMPPKLYLSENKPRLYVFNPICSTYLLYTHHFDRCIFRPFSVVCTIGKITYFEWRIYLIHEVDYSLGLFRFWDLKKSGCAF